MSEAIGILGGTFDPVHHGHLLLARDAVEELGLARLIFVPAAVNPFKLGQAAGAPGELRLAMLRAATAGAAGFAVDDTELRRAGPSYTFDTVSEIQRREPDARLVCLIGADNVPGLPRWHRSAELRAMAEFIVFRRGTDHAANAAGLRALTPRRVDISATEIRNRVAAGRTIRYLVPEAVAEIITAHRLYQTHPPPGGSPPLPPKP